MNKRIKQIENCVLRTLLSTPSIKNRNKIKSKPTHSHTSSLERYKISTIHSYFDRDCDGYLNYDEMCRLDQAMSRQRISDIQFIHLCQALHCDPQHGLDVRGLQLLYSDLTSFLFSYCDVNSDGYLSYHEMHLLRRIVEGENNMMRLKEFNDVCSTLNCNRNSGIDLPFLRKLVSDEYYNLVEDFDRLCNDKRSEYTWCKSSMQDQMRDFSNHSDSTSVATCVASSTVVAASTSTTCGGSNFLTKLWVDDIYYPLPLMDQALCDINLKQQMTPHGKENIELSEKLSNSCVPCTSALTACTAPSVIIPASVSATFRAENVSDMRNLSQLGMEMEHPYCSRSY